MFLLLCCCVLYCLARLQIGREQRLLSLEYLYSTRLWRLLSFKFVFCDVELSCWLATSNWQVTWAQLSDLPGLPGLKVWRNTVANVAPPQRRGGPRSPVPVVEESVK
jgi:hypothetical protein